MMARLDVMTLDDLRNLREDLKLLIDAGNVLQVGPYVPIFDLTPGRTITISTDIAMPHAQRPDPDPDPADDVADDLPGQGLYMPVEAAPAPSADGAGEVPAEEMPADLPGLREGPVEAAPAPVPHGAGEVPPPPEVPALSALVKG